MEEQYRKAFQEVFELDANFDLAGLEYQSITEWDSVGHMSLIARVEDEFSVSLDIDDVIDFDSFTSGMEILRRYGVHI